jgi:NADPH-dependent 2,4-dienoyl-CoA reductase/sulfur reductase-like enzyme
MLSYRYLIIGGGMAADAAIGGIRHYDRVGTIGVISADPFPPYQKPPLSKKLWDEQPSETLWLMQWSRQPQVDVHLNTRAVHLDPSSRVVTDARSAQYHYEKLLIAAGGQPRRLAGQASRVFYPGSYWEHVRLVRALGNEPRTVLVVGGGFIGAEMSVALAKKGHRVRWIFPQPAPWAHLLPATVTTRLSQAYQDHGVQCMAGERVQQLDDGPAGVVATLASGSTVTADLAVVGIGWQYDTDWLRQAGIECRSGVLVDDHLQTSVPDVFAAGDIAEPRAGQPMPHEDQAVNQGRWVGRHLAHPSLAPYDHCPFFYSDVFAWGFEAVGRIDAQLTIVEDWVVTGEEGVLYYLDQNRLVGVLCWNVWDGVDTARQMLAHPGTVTPSELRGKIRNQHA